MFTITSRALVLAPHAHTEAMRLLLAEAIGVYRNGAGSAISCLVSGINNAYPETPLIPKPTMVESDIGQRLLKAFDEMEPSCGLREAQSAV